MTDAARPRSKIVIAFDGSAVAGTAVRAAAALFPGARATVLTVHEAGIGAERVLRVGGGLMPPDVVRRAITGLEQEIIEAARSVATAGVGLCEEAGLLAEPAVVSADGQAWKPILRVADKQRAEVVVCGSRGRGAVTRSVLGSTSSSLLHHADGAVLVVPGAGEELDGPALIAYDGSPAAREAIAAAGQLLAGRPALVVHAWESPLRHSATGRAMSRAPLFEISEMTEDLEAWLGEAAEATVREGVELAQSVGFDATGEAVESATAAWRVLAATAETRNASVVVAGSQGHGRVASVLLGSVSAGLVHHADRPVLIIKSTASSEPLDSGD